MNDLNMKRVIEVGGKKYLVSTVGFGDMAVHLGYSHETMIFDEDEMGRDCYCRRYNDRQKAVAGHDQTVAALEKNELELY